MRFVVALKLPKWCAVVCSALFLIIVLPLFAQRLHEIRDNSWNASGDFIAVVDGDGSLTLYNAIGTPIRTVDQHGTIAAISWHPSQPEQIAVLSDAGRIYIQDVNTDRILRAYEVYDMYGTVPPLNDVAFNPEGNFLAVGSGDPNSGGAAMGYVYRIRLEDGQTQRFDPVYAHIYRVSWSIDSKFIIGADITDEGELFFWDANTGNLETLISEKYEFSMPETGSIPITGGYITDFAVNPVDGRIAVLAGSVSIYSSGEPVLLTKNAWLGLATDVAWSPTGHWLVGNDPYLNTIYIVDPDTGRRLAEAEIDFSATSIAWSPDGSQIACTGSAGEIIVLKVNDILMLDTSPQH